MMFRMIQQVCPTLTIFCFFFCFFFFFLFFLAQHKIWRRSVATIYIINSICCESFLHLKKRKKKKKRVWKRVEEEERERERERERAKRVRAKRGRRKKEERKDAAAVHMLPSRFIRRVSVSIFDKKITKLQFILFFFHFYIHSNIHTV